jgi:Na+/H+-dicarboxylate symporter
MAPLLCFLEGLLRLIAFVTAYHMALLHVVTVLNQFVRYQSGLCLASMHASHHIQRTVRSIHHVDNLAAAAGPAGPLQHVYASIIKWWLESFVCYHLQVGIGTLQATARLHKGRMGVFVYMYLVQALAAGVWLTYGNYLRMLCQHVVLPHLRLSFA